jgi:transcriptional regulator with XRE-family HTH domain
MPLGPGVLAATIGRSHRLAWYAKVWRVEKRKDTGMRARRLGMVLRRLRDQSGLTADKVSAQIGLSPSWIYRAETGTRGLKRDDLLSLLTAYAVDRSLRNAMLKLHDDAQKPDFLDRGDLHEDLQKWISFELDATRIRNYEPLLVPGLMQTFPYASAVIAAADPGLTEEEVGDRVAARIARQSLLRGANPPRLDVILHEAALRQRVGGAKVMREQLGYLIEVAARPGITVRVIPARTGAHTGMNGPFVIMDYAELPSIVHLENKVASLYLDEAADVKTYKLAYDGLVEVAHSPERSVALIGEVISGVA